MKLKATLENIVKDNLIHAQWLNTLSFMENAGARKISASEDRQKVSLIILKHAAEEHRHAYYLKRQIAKLGEDLCENYEDQYLLAPKASKYYLNNLMIEYLSSGNPEETFSIPIQFREAMLAWIAWRDIANMPTTRKGNLGDKRDRKQEFYNQRRLANAQFKPLYLMQAYEQNLDTQRMTVKA